MFNNLKKKIQGGGASTPVRTFGVAGDQIRKVNRQNFSIESIHPKEVPVGYKAYVLRRQRDGRSSMYTFYAVVRRLNYEVALIFLDVILFCEAMTKMIEPFTHHHLPQASLAL